MSARSKREREERQPLLKGHYGDFKEKEEEENISNWAALKELWRTDCLPCIPARYVLAFITFFGFVNVYALRVNLSMAIVEMVNTSANSSSHHQFNWTTTQEGWILSAFFYGYIITQVPGGWLASRYGGRIVFGIGIVMTAVLSLFTPLAAKIDYRVLIALRVLEGFFEGVTFPAMHAIWGKWAPPAERSILTTITYSGPWVGNVISFPLSAVLCVYGFDGGWPSVFYVFGAVGTVWFFFWLLLGFDSPSTHPRISKQEREYIESSIAAANIYKDDRVPVPWFQIFTSPPMWAIIVAHFSVNWGNYTLLTCIPSYFHDALGLHFDKDVIQNGLFSGIPYVPFVIVSLVAGYVADFLRKKWISTKNVRKAITLLACVVGAGGLLVTGYFGKRKLDSVIYLCISVGGVGMAQAGFNINHIDIAPRFAGVLMGITNTIATIPGIVGPLVAKVIAKRPPDNDRQIYQEEWREVFIIAAELYLFGAAIYVILADGKKQWWADGVKKRKDEEVASDEKKTSFTKETIQYLPEN